MRKPHFDQGFTLAVLMLAVVMWALLCGVSFQLVFAETRQGGPLAQSSRLKQFQRCTPELVKGDLELASHWGIDPDRSGVGPVLWLVGDPNSPPY